MNPDEVEFFAEKSNVSIIPTFNNDVVNLISGDVGPFRASIPIVVPLWMAISLKKQQLCKIQQLEWMDLDVLQEIKDQEIQSRNFTKMPSNNYMVEAKLLLGCASDDIPRADEIRTLIKDIWDIRMSKLRKSVNDLTQDTAVYAALDYLTPFEINTVRPILPHTLDQMYRIKATKKETYNPSQTTFSTTRHSLNTSGMPSTSFSR